MTDEAPASALDEAAIHALANSPAPATYVHWKLCRAGARRTGMEEAAFYTDTWVLGEYETGPLKFISTMAHGFRQMDLRPAIVVRFSYYRPAYGYAPARDTRDAHYHGGDHFDEVAALTSLVLGIRAQAGPLTREFREPGDPLGSPIMLTAMKAIPALFPSDRNPMVPRLSEQVNLPNLSAIERIPTLPEEAASVVIKAARTYQSALWFADSHPEMSWLFLVSAIESAAGYWAGTTGHFANHELFLPEVVPRF